MTATCPSPEGVATAVPLAVLHFVMAVAGWIGFMVINGLAGGDAFWQMGKGIYFLVLGVQVLLFESALFLFVANWSAGGQAVSLRTRRLVLCTTSFVGGASLMIVFVGLDKLVEATSLPSVGDGTMAFATTLALTPVACALMVAALTRISVWCVQQVAKHRDA